MLRKLPLPLPKLPSGTIPSWSSPVALPLLPRMIWTASGRSMYMACYSAYSTYGVLPPTPPTPVALLLFTMHPFHPAPWIQKGKGEQSRRAGWRARLSLARQPFPLHFLSCSIALFLFQSRVQDGWWRAAAGAPLESGAWRLLCCLLCQESLISPVQLCSPCTAA